MQPSHICGRFLSLFALVWAFFSCLLHASAQSADAPAPPTPTSPIQMALSSPFAQTQKPLAVAVRSRHWFPVGVTLSNTGEEVEGEVRLKLRARGGFQNQTNEFLARVRLPANSRKIVWLYGRMERSEITGFQVTFSGRGFQPLSALADIIDVEADRRLVVILSDQNDGLNSIFSSLRAQALFRGGVVPRPNTGISPVLATQSSKENVPDRWIGMEAADLVVLGDFSHSALSPLQIEAVRGYATGGGTIVALGGADAARYASSPFRDLWPLNPLNSVSASAREVRGLTSRYVAQPQNGADRLGGAPVVVTRGSLKRGAVLRDGTRTGPLFSVQNIGAGHCIFLGFNPAAPPFVGWSGQGNLWREIFSAAKKIKRLESVDATFMATGASGNNFHEDSGPSAATDRLLDTLSRAPQLKLPPASEILWFLMLYVFFLVPVNYAVLRFFDRRELAWVTIPLIVMIFSLLAYWQALRVRGSTILTRQVEVVQTSLGSTHGRSDSLLWLFSPRRTTYLIQSQGITAAVADYSNQAGVKQGAVDIFQPDDGRSFIVERAPLWMWTDRAFAAQSLVNLGTGIDVVGRTFRNGTNLDLEGAIWVQDRRIWPIGTIKKGRSATLHGVGQSIEAFSRDIASAAELGQSFDTATIANGIPIRTLDAVLSADATKFNGEAMLIAWAKTALSPMPVAGANGRNLTLFVARASVLPLELAAREATAPRGY